MSTARTLSGSLERLLQSKRSTFLWLRWLHIIALSYMMLFHTGALHLSSYASLLIVFVIASNGVLMLLPKKYFLAPWFDRLVIGADIFVVSMAMLVTEFSSEYLLAFYFLLILMTTIGKESKTAIVNGIVVVGIYIAVLFHRHGTDLLDRPSTLFEIPFLIICCVFFSVMVHSEESRRKEAAKSASERIGHLETELERRERELGVGRAADARRSDVHAELVSQFKAQREELTQSQMALAGNEKRLFQFMDKVPFGVHVIDANGKTYFANQTAVELLGPGIVQETELDGLIEPYRICVVDTDEPYPTEKLPSVRALQGERVAAMDMEVDGPHGTIPLFVESSPVVDSHGKVEFVISAFQDIAERRRLEKQLRQSQKMEAVGRLAGGVAHDFNNILTAIFSFGRFVKDSLHPLDPAYEDMEELLLAGTRAQELTAQLLAFSRQKTVEPRVLDPNELVTNIERMLRRVVGEDVDVSVEVGDKVGNVEIDPGAFEQVVVNLAVNARDAMPGGGRLRITTNRVNLEAERSVGGDASVPPGEYVVLSVSDSGTGMDEKTRAQVFEPFFSTKGDAGSGLGLSTCYGIVTQASGYFLIHSAPGKGATFEVYLPVSDEEKQEACVETLAATTDGNETVLVVEDDDVVRKLIVRTLEARGYVVMEAAAGKAALGMHERLLEHVQLLVTDLVMPSMNGRVLSEQLLDRHPQLRVLYVSGYSAEAAGGAPVESSALLNKPFTPDELLQRVRAVLDAKAREAPEPVKKEHVQLVEANKFVNSGPLAN